MSSQADGHVSIKRLSCYECGDTCSNQPVTGPATQVKMIPENDTGAEDDNDVESEHVPLKQLVKRNILVAIFIDENDDGYFLMKTNRQSYKLNKKK